MMSIKVEIFYINIWMSGSPRGIRRWDSIDLQSFLAKQGVAAAFLLQKGMCYLVTSSFFLSFHWHHSPSISTSSLRAVWYCLYSLLHTAQNSILRSTQIIRKLQSQTYGADRPTAADLSLSHRLASCPLISPGIAAINCFNKLIL